MMQYLSFSVQLISLIVTSSKFIGVANGKISFFSKVEQYSIACEYYIFLSMHPSTDLGCSPTFAIVNNTAMNVEVQISL